jgi:hypothetical protein
VRLTFAVVKVCVGIEVCVGVNSGSDAAAGVLVLGVEVDVGIESFEAVSVPLLVALVEFDAFVDGEVFVHPVNTIVVKINKQILI